MVEVVGFMFVLICVPIVLGVMVSVINLFVEMVGMLFAFPVYVPFLVLMVIVWLI